MAIINNRSKLETDPLRNFRFLVTFSPLDSGDFTSSAMTNLTKATMGFVSVSGLSVTTDSIAYREGGYNTTVHQMPGQTSFSQLTLQRGVMLGNRQAWDWMRMLFATVQGGADVSATDNFRCEIDIQVLSHPVAKAAASSANSTNTADEHTAMRFKVYNAWITSLAYSDLNAGDNAIFVEQMTLVHEGFDTSWATNLTTNAPALN
jgi:phage tail-like protein